MSRTVRVILAALALHAVARAQDDAITLDHLKQLASLGTSEDDLVRLVEGAASVRMTDDDVAALKAAGVAERVVKAVAARVEGDLVQRVITLTAEGKSEDEILRRVIASGRRIALSANDKLRLVQGKVATNVIRAIEGSFVFPGFKRYQDPLGVVALQHPEGWASYHWFTGEGLKILVSPETNVPAANKFTTGLQIQISNLQKSHASKRHDFDPMAHYKRALPAFIHLNRSYAMAPLGEPRAGSFGGHRAVEHDFSVRMLDTACREVLIDAFVEDFNFLVEGVAPQAKYDETIAAFRTILASAQVFPERRTVTRRSSPMKGTEALEAYREAVVMVECDFGSGVTGRGSGFFVREDGYVLTNHHVICNDPADHIRCHDRANWKLPRSIKLVWDLSVPALLPNQARREVAATLEDSHFLNVPKIDLALLKVQRAKTPYKTIPTTTVASGLVKEGDPVVALGFPKPFDLGAGNLVLTSGSISRINYIERKLGRGATRRELNDLFTDALINHGNSGGPCVDLASGAVIGLNTYRPVTSKNEVLEYAGIVLVDQIQECFPQLRWYPKSGRLKAAEHLELGAMLLAHGNARSAEVEFAQAAKGQDELDPTQHARLDHNIATLCSRADDGSNCEKHLDLSLQSDPGYVDALIDKARAHVDRKEFDKALELIDRVVLEQPDNYWSHYHRANVLYTAGENAKAREALGRAQALGGAEADSAIPRLSGLIAAAEGRTTEALESYQKAFRLDATDYEARVFAAEVEAANNAERGTISWNEVARDFADNAWVQEQHGRFLLGIPARFDDAIKTLSAAAIMAIDNDGRAPEGLLYDLADRTITEKGYEATGIDAAKLLSEQWPRSHGPHELLVRFWTREGRTILAAAHQNAAARMAGTDVTSPPGLFTRDDVAALAAAGYSGAPRLLGGTLMESSVGFIPEKADVEKTPDEQLWRAVITRFQMDQRLGSPALGQLLSITFVDGNYTETEDHQASGVAKFTNTGSIPLTSVLVTETYLDKDSKVLGAITRTLVLPNDPVIRADGQTLTYNYMWAPPEDMTRAGVDYTLIETRRLAVASAKNAFYLAQIPVEGGVVPGGFNVVIVNQSPFSLSSATVRCSYKTSDGAPVVRADGAPVADERRYTLGPLGSGQKTETISIPDWVNEDYLRRLGVPSDVDVATLNIHFFVSAATIAEN